jgi:transcriptional regulator
MVQVRGQAQIIEDRSWLRNHVSALTRDREASRDKPWDVADAPHDFVESQLKGIVGFEIAIRLVEGKWKVSQNRAAGDRAGVADGLAADGQHAMADLVKRYGSTD